MNHIRHSGIFDCSKTAVSLIGLGGIGAITALTLAKMGVGYLTLVDDDSVSEENLATQLYELADLGAKKTLATRDNILFFSDDVAIETFTGRVDNGRFVSWSDFASEIIISGVDSIQSRHEIWDVITPEPWQWYIDCRMGAESLLMYVIDGSIWSRAWYASILVGQSDADVLDAPCTSKATFFCAAGAACLIGKTVRQIVTGDMAGKRIISWDILSDRMVTI